MILRNGTAALFISLVSFGLVAQRTATEPPKNLNAYESAKVLAHIDRKIYSLHDEIVLEAGLENTGRHPIYVYDTLAWGYGGGLVLEIHDEAGQLIKPSMFDDTMLPPPQQDDRNVFVRLRVGNFFGNKRLLRVRDIIASPGKYTLRVRYNSPFSRSFAEKYYSGLVGLPALWHEDPPIWSETISLEIRTDSTQN